MDARDDVPYLCLFVGFLVLKWSVQARVLSSVLCKCALYYYYSLLLRGVYMTRDELWTKCDVVLRVVCSVSSGAAGAAT